MYYSTWDWYEYKLIDVDNVITFPSGVFSDFNFALESAMEDVLSAETPVAIVEVYLESEELL